MSNCGLAGLIVHQFDAVGPHRGGIDGCISDIIAYAPRDTLFAVAGATSGGLELGRWHEITHRGRPLMFMPVARLWQRERRRVPDSAQLGAGLLRWRRRLPAAPIQVHTLEVAAATKLAVRGSGYIQFIHNQHGRSQGIFGPGSDSFWRFAPSIYRRLENRLLRRADRIVVFSRAETERLKNAGFDPVYWQSWFDPSVFSFAEAPKSQVIRIAYIGRLEREKDPFLALEAVAELSKRCIEVEIHFMGGGSMRTALEQHARELDIDKVVVFQGARDREDVARLLHESHVLLLTSHYEGSPRVVIEALATGTPVATIAEADPDALVVTSVTGARAATRSASAVAGAVLEATCCPSEGCVAAVAHLRADRVVPELLAATDVTIGI